MTEKRARPANRPSRRADIVRAAVNLLAIQTPDSLSVSDIVAEAGMTPAAFYYHFPSKDELVGEIVNDFAVEWVDEILARLARARTPEDFPELISGLIDWLDERERPAKVFFVTSVAATEQVEEIRRKARDQLYVAAIEARRRVWPKAPEAEISVTGVALIVLLEVASHSRLQMDESYVGLGPVRFRQAAAGLVRGMAS